MTQPDQESSEFPSPVLKKSAGFEITEQTSAKTKELGNLPMSSMEVDNKIKLNASERENRESEVRQQKEFLIVAFALVILSGVLIAVITIIANPQSLQADKEWARGIVTTIVTATVGYIFVAESKKNNT